MGRFKDTFNSISEFFKPKDDSPEPNKANDAHPKVAPAALPEKQQLIIIQQKPNGTPNYFPRNVSGRELLARAAAQNHQAQPQRIPAIARYAGIPQEVQQQRIDAKRKLDLERAKGIGERRLQQSNYPAIVDRRNSSNPNRDVAHAQVQNRLLVQQPKPAVAQQPRSAAVAQQPKPAVAQQPRSAAQYLKSKMASQQNPRYTTSRSSNNLSNNQMPINNSHKPSYNPLPGPKSNSASDDYLREKIGPLKPVDLTKQPARSSLLGSKELATGRMPPATIAHFDGSEPDKPSKNDDPTNTLSRR